MLDLGWSELLLIGIVALIVVGPKDLPKLFRNIGRWVGKARGLATEFQRAMNAAADETGVKDMARDLKSSVGDKDLGLDAIKDLQKGPKAWARDHVIGRDTASDVEDIDKAAQGAGDGKAIVRQRKAGTSATSAPPPDEAAEDMADIHDAPAPSPAPPPPVESSQYPPRPSTPAAAAPEPAAPRTEAAKAADGTGGGKDGAA